MPGAVGEGGADGVRGAPGGDRCPMAVTGAVPGPSLRLPARRSARHGRSRRAAGRRHFDLGSSAWDVRAVKDGNPGSVFSAGVPSCRTV